MDAAAAAERQPGNVQFKYWLNAYRWRSISRAVDPDTGALMLTDRSLEAAERITGELHAARALCPTFGPVLCLAGQLELLLLDRPQQGAGHVRLGRELSPNDPSAVFAAALVDVSEQQWDASLERVRHCLTLNGNTITDVQASYIGADRPDLALAVADGNAFWLLKVAVALRADARHADVMRQAQEKFLALIDSEEQQNQANGWTLFEAANLCRDRGDAERAIAYYESAVAKDYGQVGWRLELAKCLAADGKSEAAMREARLCLRLRPQSAEARKLIDQLNASSAGGGRASTKPATRQSPATRPEPATPREAIQKSVPAGAPAESSESSESGSDGAREIRARE
jgi:tetratricopeptide (TPR) repeat protein